VLMLVNVLWGFGKSHVQGHQAFLVQLCRRVRHARTHP
jgi:hypothetical protein